MSSKRYKKFPEKTKNLAAESFEILLPKIKSNCTTKFDESIDLSLQINNKQKKGEVNLRTVVNMPSGTGKNIKVAVLCDESKKTAAEKAGADLVGGEDLIEKIKAGELNFEKLICTPKMMISLSKLGKILGPKGLMPNPKLGTVSNDLKKSITDIKTGLIEVKNDKDGNLALSIGRKNFPKEKLEENYKYFIEFLKKEKSENIKGEFIKNIFLTSTMGISYKIGSKN